MTDQYNDLQRPVRRRQKTNGPAILMITAAVLTVALAGLMIWGASLRARQDSPEQTDPPGQTQSTGQTESSEQTEPSTEETEPMETEPEETTAEDIIAAFAAQNGLTMDDYPQKLIELLDRNPETEEYVLNFPLEYGKEHEVDISGYADSEGVPLFIQWDKQWGYLDYVGNQAGLAACGPTCLSMVAYHLTKDPTYTPVYMMEFAESNGYAKAGSGTTWSLFSEGGPQLGFTVQELPLVEGKIVQALEDGKPVVVSVGPGVFTEIGHYILLVGYEDGKFRVNDPNSYSNSEKLWALEEFSESIRNLWAFSL